MNAAIVLQRLRETYASAGFYRDRGDLIIVSEDKPGRHDTIKGAFRTTFLRSKGFRFEFRGLDKLFAIRTEGRRIVEIVGFEHSGYSLGDAIAAMTGITFATAHVVPRMLLPEEILGRALWDASSPCLKGQAAIDGDVCSIVDVGREGRRQEIFVSETDFTLRRVFQVNEITDKLLARARARGVDLGGVVRSTQTVTYAPEIHADEPPHITLGTDDGPEPG